MTIGKFFFSDNTSGLEIKNNGLESELIVAYLKKYEKNVPLLIKREEEVVFKEPLPEFILSTINEKAFSKDFYFWKYFPFNYRKVPLSLRDAILWALMKRGKFRDGTEIKQFVSFIKYLRENKFYFRGNGISIFFLEAPLLLLSHDIETANGFKMALKMANIEESLGFRSTWFIITGEYKIDESVLNELVIRGHKIGWHEFKHDNRFPFLSQKGMEKRIAKSMDFIKKYNVKGFRSPSYLFSEKMFKKIREYFAYDSSRLDYDIISGGRQKGCYCPYPFLLESGLLEIPVTIPWEIPFISDEPLKDYWERKIALLLENNALIHINTHPDPHYSGNGGMMTRYEILLTSLRGKNIKNVSIEELTGVINAERC